MTTFDDSCLYGVDMEKREFCSFFPTYAHTSAQESWVKQQIGKWSDDIAENNNLTLIEKRVGNFLGNNVVVLLRFAFPDREMKKCCIRDLALKIAKENKLPFDISHDKIPFPAGKKVRYIIDLHDYRMVPEKDVKKFESKNFFKDFSGLAAKHNVELVKVFIGTVYDGKIVRINRSGAVSQVGFVVRYKADSYQHTFSGTDFTNAASKFLETYFKRIFDFFSKEKVSYYIQSAYDVKV